MVTLEPKFFTVNRGYCIKGGKKYLNSERLMIPCVQAGEYFDISSSGNCIILKRTQDCSARKVTAAGNDQRYLNIRGYVEPDIDFMRVTRTAEGFFLSPVKRDADDMTQKIKRKKRKEGYIDSNNFVKLGNIPRSEDGRIKVTLHIKGHQYIELEAYDGSEDLPKFADRMCMAAQWKNSLPDEFSYISRVSREKLYIPKRAMRAFELKPDSYISVWETKDGKTILEPDPIICDVCGKPIHRYAEGHITFDVCSSCKSTVKILQKKMKNETGNITEKLKKAETDYEFLLKELKEIKCTLESCRKETL